MIQAKYADLKGTTVGGEKERRRLFVEMTPDQRRADQHKRREEALAKEARWQKERELMQEEALTKSLLPQWLAQAARRRT